MKPLVIEAWCLGLCILLKWIGEVFQHNAQRFVLPLVLVGTMILVEILLNDSAFAWVIISLFMIWPIDEGYKAYGSNDQVARASWLAVIYAVVWIIPVIMGHIYGGWFTYVPGLALAGAVGRWVRDWPNWLGAPLNAIAAFWPILLFH